MNRNISLFIAIVAVSAITSGITTSSMLQGQLWGNWDPFSWFSEPQTGPQIHFEGNYCGNGFKEAWEECDDGNNENGDGCSMLCALEPPTTVSIVCQIGTAMVLRSVRNAAQLRVDQLTADLAAAQAELDRATQAYNACNPPGTAPSPLQ